MKGNMICDKKRSFSILKVFIVVFMFMMIYTKINAAEMNYTDNEDYLSMFYSGYNDTMVTNEEEDDVTQWFMSRTTALFQQNRIAEIKEIIAEEKLTLHVLVETQTYALEQYKSVRSDMQYFVLWDTNYAVSLEVTSELVGGIWYNPNTGAVTKTSTPTYTILSQNCASPEIETYANNFQTGSSVVSGKGYFWGSCSFGGQAYVMDDKNPNVRIPIDYNFRSKRVSFYATP